MVSEHERDTAFLRQCIVYADSTERGKVEERITQVQRDERCVRRAVWVMAHLTALSAVGLGYGVLLQENFPYGKSRFAAKLLCEFGLASLISLVAFVALLMAYRKDLNRLRGECRRLATTLLESRLGKPWNGIVKEQGPMANHNKHVESASEMVALPWESERTDSPAC